MKRMTRVLAVCLSVPVMALSLGGATGCDRDTAAELVVLSGSYLGDVVTTVSTQFWLDRLGVEAESDAHAEDEADHAHDAEPMHDHEH